MNKMRNVLKVASIIDICVTVAVFALSLAMIVVGATLFLTPNNDGSNGAQLSIALGAVFGVLFMLIGAVLFAIFVYFLISTILTSTYVKKGVERVYKKRGVVIASAVMSYLSTALFIAAGVLGYLNKIYAVFAVGILLAILEIVDGTLKVKGVIYACDEHAFAQQNQLEEQEQGVLHIEL